MSKANSSICVIPARLSSTRLKEKVLLPLLGKPLMVWAYQSALNSGAFDEVVLALDDEKTAQVAEQFGCKWVMTPKDLTSGSMRLAFVAKTLKQTYSTYVNWQGDLPYLPKALAHKLSEPLGRKVAIRTLYRPIYSQEEKRNPNIVKVAMTQNKRALYFSRSPIPFSFEEDQVLFQHIGIYVFSEEALKKIFTLTPSELEKREKLEQLTFLEHNIPIYLQQSEEVLIDVNTEQDVEVAELFLKEKLQASSLVDASF